MVVFEGGTEEVKEAKMVKLAPTNMRLNVDIDFLKFVKNRLIKQKEVLTTGITLPVGFLGHALLFKVLETDPAGKVKVTRGTFLDIQGKWYRTCTLKGLGSKKEYFLKRLIWALENEGFRLSEGSEWLRDYFLNKTGSKDIRFVSDKKGEIFLRAEKQGDDLKIGYLNSKTFFGLQRMRNKIDKLVVETAESMGAKKINLFKNDFMD